MKISEEELRQTPELGFTQMTPLVLLYTYCESWFQRKTPTQLKIDWKRPMYKNG